MPQLCFCDRGHFAVIGGTLGLGAQHPTRGRRRGMSDGDIIGERISSIYNQCVAQRCAGADKRQSRWQSADGHGDRLNAVSFQGSFV